MSTINRDSHSTGVTPARSTSEASKHTVKRNNNTKATASLTPASHTGNTASGSNSTSPVSHKKPR